MVGECSICGRREALPFTCRFCGETFCLEHRLPEQHQCPGLLSFREKARQEGRLYIPLGVERKRKRVFPDFSFIRRNYALTILALGVISFVLQLIPGYFDLFALYPKVVAYRPWTLVSYIFIHKDFFHLFFNMLFLFFFGPELERRIGGKRFLVLFFLSGIVAGFGYVLWSLFTGIPAPGVGASGALYGIFACLAVLAPRLQVYFYFIPIRITYALILFALFDILLIGSKDMIAHAAHLSGLAVGLGLGFKLRQKSFYY